MTILQGHHTDSVIWCDFSTDNNFIWSLSITGNVLIWNSHTFLITSVIETEIEGISCAKLHPSSTYLAVGAESIIHLLEFDVETCYVSNELKLNRVESSGIVTSVDWLLSATTGIANTVIASGWSDGSIALFDVESGHEIIELVGHSDAIVSVAFCIDGTKLASSSKDKTCRVK